MKVACDNLGYHNVIRDTDKHIQHKETFRLRVANPVRRQNGSYCRLPDLSERPDTMASVIVHGISAIASGKRHVACRVWNDRQADNGNALASKTAQSAGRKVTHRGKLPIEAG